MGKGSNVQKAQQARERNAKKQGKSEEERKAASAKAKTDAQAFKCAICLQTFMISAKPPVLYQHVVAKHPGDVATPEKCFAQLKDFDPNDPKGEKKAAAEKTEAAKAKKATSKNNDDLDLLLDAGLGGKKKNKK